jgi:hypothetical protein
VLFVEPAASARGEALIGRAASSQKQLGGRPPRSRRGAPAVR